MIAATAAAVAMTAWRIDYVSNWSGRNAVYSVKASGGPVDLVSSEGPSSYRPWLVASPDGRRVVFGEDPTTNTGADGHGATTLATKTAPAWSPDSTRIAYFSGDALHVARADGSVDRVVRNVAAGAIAWSRDSRHVRVVGRPEDIVSPDGRWLAEPRYAGRYEVVIHPDGSTYPNAVLLGRWPAWSPNSRRLAWSTDRGVAVFDVRTWRSRLLTADRGAKPAWSPDGTALAYLSPYSDYDATPSDIRTVSMGGRSRVVVPAERAGVVAALATMPDASGLRYRAAPEQRGVFAFTPIDSVAADGTRVAFEACERLAVWTPATGAVAGRPQGNCGLTASVMSYSVALAGSRVAWMTWYSWGMVTHSTVQVGTLGGELQTLVSFSEPCCTSYPVIGGRGSVLVYADRTGDSKRHLWKVREPGGPSLISFEQDAEVGVDLDVDGDRVLVAHDGAVDVVLTENGGTVFHLDLPGIRRPHAQLDGPTVDVRDGANLRVYATDGGALLHTWPLPMGAKLLDAAHGLAALTDGHEIYVVRVSDGVFTHVAPGTLAAFFDGGLAYANGARLYVAPYGQLPSFGVRSSGPSARQSGDQ